MESWSCRRPANTSERGEEAHGAYFLAQKIPVLGRID